MSDDAEPRLAKIELRRRLAAARGEVDAATRDAWSELIAERLMGEVLPSTGAEPRTVLAFDGFGSEVRTEGLVARLTARGVRVVLPFVRGEVMEASEAGAESIRTTYGPREPARPVAIDPALIDMVLVPGLAFDLHGYRLGYGRGHFDRYLRRIRPDALRVGVAFDLQLIDEVPHGPDDERVDAVVTERRTVWCEPSRPARR
ncbi:MAG TPA: 5-formyltetrahydrofolate cyclo-ligase [Actinobacteria bacterium]|jgi:5-formyltetrahydrofolate cyclo-ligase|nr:5-formyltetrahydrofolate cyclo-ligase [Actinomycetota bacterium]